jgi:hypothetical protein
MRDPHGAGRGRLKGAAIGLLAQPIPWLMWWTAGPHHHSLRLQWHEGLAVFVAITLGMTAREMWRVRKQGRPPGRA